MLRLFVQGLLAVTLALTLAVVLQSRVLDGDEKAPIPDWLRRVVPVVDVLVTAALATVGVVVVAGSLAVLRQNKPLDPADEEVSARLQMLVAALGAWVFAVAVLRRVLPLLWRRNPTLPWRVEVNSWVWTIGFPFVILGSGLG